MNLAKVFDLFQKLDPETVTLFMTFLDQAKTSSDPNAFVKEALRKVVKLPTVEVRRG